MSVNSIPIQKRITEAASQIYNVMELLHPHLVWIVGLMFFLDPFIDYYRTDSYVHWLSTEPQITMWAIGLMLFLCGRIAVGYRKKWRREKRRADRKQEQVDELNDALIDEVQLSEND